MKKLGWMVALAAVAIACGSASDMVSEMMDSGVPDAGAQPTPTPTAKFVGYTSEAHKLSESAGVGGLFNTYAACQADFGAASRICTVAEVLGTLDLPAPPPTSSGNNSEGAWTVETLDTVPSCWANTSGASGRYLSPGGQLISQGCTVLRVLACCTVN